MRQNLIVEKQWWSPWTFVSIACFFWACAPAARETTPPDTPLPGARASPAAPPVPDVAFVLHAPHDEDDPPCPAEMVLVSGMYCPGVKQTCIKWVDPPTSPFPFIRCAEFKEPATCEGTREQRRYCIDREEFIRPPDVLPLVHVTWTDAESECEMKGARLCTEAEWSFACEGEEMLPYPYGYKRDATMCNFDRTDLGRPQEGLTDHRMPPEEFPQCMSPFGVHDMVGNVDEWTLREGMPAPYRSALHGGWWLPGRNNCRAATLGHTEIYLGPQVGFRCCKDAD